MTRPRGPLTFVANDNEFLWLAMTCRDTGRPMSQVLNIKDEALALDLDLAATLRLFVFDNEKDEANRQFWVSLVAREQELEIPD